MSNKITDVRIGSQTFPVSKVTVVKGRRFRSLHFDLLADGTVRIIAGTGMIEDLGDVETINLIKISAGGGG